VIGGTGRVVIRLAQLGYAVTGVDLEPSMLEMARVALGRVVQCLAGLLRAGGLAAANLHLLSRHDTWEGTPSSGDGYAGSVYRVS